MIFRFISLFLSLAGFYLFMQPVLRYAIFNIGNVTGLLVSFLLLSFAIFRPALMRVGKAMHQTMAGHIGYYCIIGLLFLCISLTCVCSFFIIHSLYKKPSNEATLIVLGCKVSGKKPSMMLEERIHAAYVYLLAHPEAKAILSGGKGNGEDISEAECMYQELIKRSIAPNRLYQENKSMNTRQNLVFSKKIIQNENLHPKIAIVSNEFHEYRAGIIAKKLGMNYGTVPAATAWWMLPTYYVRELYCILYEWVR